MRLIDADALLNETRTDYPDVPFDALGEMVEWFTKIVDEQPTVTASPWRMVEDNPPDEKTDAIFYYEWTGINGIRGREISTISLGALIALECRPIAWMEKPKPPKPPKEDA